MRSVILCVMILLTSAAVQGQTFARGVSCPLAGAYRVDVDASDKLYSVVKSATSRVPFADQQKFFMDLSTRLTPPDMLAIECRGNHVSIGSSRAAKVTFVADGKLRREARPGGRYVNSRVLMNADTLTLSSNGKAEDNVNVTFQSIDDGRRMRVVRRIMAAQLDDPIVVETVYNKFADTVAWDRYGNAQVGDQRPPAPPPVRSSSDVDDLRRDFDEWLLATNRKDIDQQMTFYLPQLDAYYLTRQTPRQRVRDEKRRVFANVRSVDIRAEEPEIVFQQGGQLAVMRFRKAYRITSAIGTKAGEVIQELRWRRTGGGWRISSERDVRVLR